MSRASRRAATKRAQAVRGVVPRPQLAPHAPKPQPHGVGCYAHGQIMLLPGQGAMVANAVDAARQFGQIVQRIGSALGCELRRPAGAPAELRADVLEALRCSKCFGDVSAYPVGEGDETSDALPYGVQHPFVAVDGWIWNVERQHEPGCDRGRLPHVLSFVLPKAPPKPRLSDFH